MCKWFSTILIIVLWSVYFSIVCMQHGAQMRTLYNDRTMKMKCKLLIDSNFWPHMSIKVLRFPSKFKVYPQNFTNGGYDHLHVYITYILLLPFSLSPLFISFETHVFTGGL